MFFRGSTVEIRSRRSWAFTKADWRFPRRIRLFPIRNSKTALLLTGSQFQPTAASATRPGLPSRSDVGFKPPPKPLRIPSIDKAPPTFLVKNQITLPPPGLRQFSMKTLLPAFDWSVTPLLPTLNGYKIFFPALPYVLCLSPPAGPANFSKTAFQALKAGER